MPKIYTIGETVYDIFLKNDQILSGKPGGSLLNTSVSLGRLGQEVIFISEMGADPLGSSIINFLKSNKVDSGYVQIYEGRKTSISIASLNERNEAGYTFYKDLPENRLPDLNIEFEENDVLMFGGYFSVQEAIRPVLLNLLESARRGGAIIIYDPNFRSAHSHELETVKPFIVENINYADLVRGSDEDFDTIFGAGNAQQAFYLLLDEGCNNLIYTANRNNVEFFSQDLKLSFEVPRIEPVSTVGAGDNFNAGVIWTIVTHCITMKDMDHLPEQFVRKMIINGMNFSQHVCKSMDNYISSEFANGLKN